MALGIGRQIGVGNACITLPDGSKREFDGPVCAMDVAESIGPDLQKQLLCSRRRRVTRYLDIISHDANVSLITAKDSEGLKSSVTHSRI